MKCQTLILKYSVHQNHVSARVICLVTLFLYRGQEAVCVCEADSSAQGSSSWAATATDDLLTADVMRRDSAATPLITPRRK